MPHAACLALLCFAFQEKIAVQEPDLRGEIDVDGGAEDLAINPETGDLWIVSGHGRAYVSRDWNRTWSRVDLPVREPDEFGLGGDRPTRVLFFDGRRAIIVGSIGKRHDEYLRTEDAGKTWTQAKLPEELWVYDARSRSDGCAWLVGSTGHLLVSTDFGSSFSIRSRPYDGVSRSRSVFFAAVKNGAVGANTSALRLTEDGGRTWRDVEAPLSSLPHEKSEDEDEIETEIDLDEAGNTVLHDLPAGPRDPVDQVCIIGDRLIALQRGEFYARPFLGNGPWTPLRAGTEKIAALEIHPQGVLVVMENGQISVLSPALERIVSCEDRLDSPPLRVAIAERGAAFLLDREGKVAVLDGTRVRASHPMSTGAERSWPLATFDRTLDGSMWGASRTSLYHASRIGADWERVAELKSPDGDPAHDPGGSVYAFSDGSGALLLGSPIYAWTKQSRRFDRISDLDELNGAVGVLRRGPLWVAWGGHYADDEETQRMLHTSDTVQVGPGFTALAFASSDDGRTWSLIDRRPGGTVEAIFLGEDGVLSEYLSSGELRRGSLGIGEGKGFHPHIETVMDPESMDARSPGVRSHLPQWAPWVEFKGGESGSIGGNQYFGGSAVLRTRDGGRTWTAEQAADLGEVFELYHLGDGALVRVSLWRETGPVQIWRSGEFRELRRLEKKIQDARLDTNGCLLLRLEDGTVWDLGRDGSEMNSIGRIAIPSR